jgi:hypothetical protein
MLEQWLRLLDDSQPAARLHRPLIAIVAQSLVADRAFELTRIPEPREMPYGEPEHGAEISRRVKCGHRPPRLPHRRAGYKPPAHAWRRLDAPGRNRKCLREWRTGAKELRQLMRPVPRRRRIGVTCSEGEVPDPHPPLSDRFLASSRHRRRIPVAGKEGAGEAAGDAQDGIRHEVTQQRDATSPVVRARLPVERALARAMDCQGMHDVPGGTPERSDAARRRPGHFSRPRCCINEEDRWRRRRDRRTRDAGRYRRQRTSRLASPPCADGGCRRAPP